MDPSTILVSFIFGILSSFFASLGYAYAADKITSLRLTKKFSKLKGRYIQCDNEGIPFEDKVSEDSSETRKRYTEIIRVDRNFLIVQGHDATENMWESEILMDERFTNFGYGFYQYKHRSDCGRHEIQVKDNGNIIFVTWCNTSHGQGNNGSLLWKKIK